MRGLPSVGQTSKKLQAECRRFQVAAGFGGAGPAGPDGIGLTAQASLNRASMGAAWDRMKFEYGAAFMVGMVASWGFGVDGFEVWGVS